MASETLQAFVDRYEALSGNPHLADSVEAVAQRVVGIAQGHQVSRIAVADVPPDIQNAIELACRAANIDVLKAPFARDNLPNTIDGVDIGVTGAAFAIAETGTLVEVCTNDATRLVSSLPRIHIGIVSAGDLVDRYNDAAAPLRQVFQTHDANCTVSFISGPSRTGDIELKLTLGVHGPKEAHAIVLET